MSRLNKYLAEQGYCSRREADAMIRAGLVFVNGMRAGLGDQVAEGDRVEVKNRVARSAPKKIYLLLNKPVGYMTTTDARKPDTVMKLVPRKDRLFPVGRLDVQSSGLLLMTNDGDLANRLTHPRYEHEKEYDVSVDKSVSDSHLRSLAEGMELDGKKTLPARVARIDRNKFSIVLREGRNRQIRRMCDLLGYTVTALCRTRVGSLKMGTLAVGKYRELGEEELKGLKSRGVTPLIS